MTEKIRIGVSGTSWWAELAHLPDLVATCGRNRERAQAMATKPGR